VLIAGGLRMFAAIPIGFVDSAQIYTPATATWSDAGSFQPTAAGPQGRSEHTATRLADGRVLVVGGAGANLDVGRVPQVFDPATGRWRLGAVAPVARMDHTATRLSDGTVLIAGGQRVLAAVPAGTLATSMRYDPLADAWTAAASLNVARWGHTATLLADGDVLVVAGAQAASVLASAERYRR
jgi:hypothetical protein